MKIKVVIILLLCCSFFYLNGQTNNIVLVHGAWHGDWCWFLVENRLVNAGYNVESIQLPGHDRINPGNITLQDYTGAVLDFLDTLAEPVVLVGHSMGGIVISSAAEMRPEKVEKLVFVSAFLLQDGQSLLDIALLDTESKVLPHLDINEIEGTVDVDTAFRQEMFYQLSPPRITFFSENLLVPNPLQPFGTPLVLSPANFGSIRRFYITTTNDNAISPSIQEQMYTASPCETVYEMITDHSSFFSRPARLTNILIEIAEG